MYISKNSTRGTSLVIYIYIRLLFNSNIIYGNLNNGKERVDSNDDEEKEFGAWSQWNEMVVEGITRAFFFSSFLVHQVGE